MDGAGRRDLRPGVRAGARTDLERRGGRLRGSACEDAAPRRRDGDRRHLPRDRHGDLCLQRFGLVGADRRQLPGGLRRADDRGLRPVGHGRRRISGACASDHTGACAYSCGDGAWTVAQNTCEPKGPEKVDGKCDNTSADACLAGDANTAGVKDSDTDHRWRCDGRHGGANSEACEFPKKACATGDLDWRVGANTCTGAVAGLESGGSRTASDDKGGTTGQAAFKCDDAVWTERPGATCGRECAAANRTWREGSDTCSGRLAKTGHLEDATATDTTYSATGTAAYRCGDAVWSGPADASCKGGCAATTLSNCVLPNTVHDGDAGRCAATHEGSCRYSCGDGNWTRSSNACEPKPVDGVCGTAARDTCAKGVPNTAAFTDSDSQHYWRCDGRHGGKNSGQCPFAKERCDRTTQSWWDGSNRCTGTVDGRSSGGTATATDPSAGPVSGEADYKCDDRRWIEQSGATCSRRCNEDNDHDNCALATKPHGETSGTCIDGLDGACAYTCNDGQWGNPSNNNCAAPENCEAGEETWTVDNVSCTGEVPAANHEKSSTATDANLYTPGDTLLATGSATYQCDDGDWGEPDPQSCHKGCAAKTTDKGCKLPDAAHNKSADGTCTGDYSGSCAYTCDEGDWEETTACSAHCQAAELTWSDGNANCTAGVAKTRSGGTGMASDTTPADTGAAKFPCAKGAWSANPENEGKTCHDGCEQTTVSGCKLPKTAKGKDGAGTCDASTARTVRYKTGACSYTCGGADSWTKKTSCTRLYRVRVTPAPVNGRVTATGINCPGDCEEYLSGNITLTATPNAGYEGVEKWTVKGSGGSCTGTRENGNVCEITVTEDTDVSVAFKQSLTADAGGDADGKYYAVGAFVGFPVNTTLYTATVKASASGGAPPYTFKWSGRATGPSTVYVYAFAGSHKEKVTVEDSKKPKKSEASDTATIVAGSGQSADAAAGGSGGGGMAPFHIPLGGELYFVWGGDGPIRARSGDTGVLSVEVDSPAVRAVGAGAGSTELVLVTRDGELPLPVVVR